MDLIKQFQEEVAYILDHRDEYDDDTVRKHLASIGLKYAKLLTPEELTPASNSSNMDNHTYGKEVISSLLHATVHRTAGVADALKSVDWLLLSVNNALGGLEVSTDAESVKNRVHSMVELSMDLFMMKCIFSGFGVDEYSDYVAHRMIDRKYPQRSVREG